MSSAACVEQRSAKLRELLSDRKHGWVELPPTVPAEYANGTRLFAFRIQRPKLSCRQIAAGLGELQRVDEAYAKQVSGVAPAQSERVRHLARDVRSEMAAESRRRCKA